MRVGTKAFIGFLLLTVILAGAIVMKEFWRNERIKARIYVVVKSVDPHFAFWQTVKMGAETAARELDVEMVFSGPMEETDVAGQIRVLEDILTKKPTAVVLAAADYQALAPVGERIMKKGIPLIAIDSAIDTPLVKSFIATNNVMAAYKAGEEMARLLENEGKVAVMAHVPGVSTAMEREKGFRDAMQHYPGIQVLKKTWFSNGDTAEGYRQTLDMLEEYPDLSGIYGTNEKTVMGIAQALEYLGLAGTIKLVGFDCNIDEVGYIEKGTLHAVMVQKPFNMGYLGVREAYEISRGKRHPKRIDTGAELIVKENLFTPENQKLLFPFSDQ